MANVTGLEDEENDPVNGSNHRVEGKSSGVEVVQVPDSSADGVAIVRRVGGVVDGGDE